MSLMGLTPVRHVRVPDELWDAAKAKTASEYRTVADVIVECLRRYVADSPPPDGGQRGVNDALLPSFPVPAPAPPPPVPAGIIALEPKPAARARRRKPRGDGMGTSPGRGHTVGDTRTPEPAASGQPRRRSKAAPKAPVRKAAEPEGASDIMAALRNRRGTS